MRTIDADALFGTLKLKRELEHISPNDYSSGKATGLNIAMDAVKSAPTVGGWISVTDRLPEKSGEYLCWFGANTVAIGAAVETYVDKWKAFGRLDTLEKYPNITHWMPLPEPPEVEDEM